MSVAELTGIDVPTGLYVGGEWGGGTGGGTFPCSTPPPRSPRQTLGTQKVTAGAKNRSDLQERANRLVGPEANGHPAMRVNAALYASELVKQVRWS
jgi:hypothetical protein